MCQTSSAWNSDSVCSKGCQWMNCPHRQPVPCYFAATNRNQWPALWPTESPSLMPPIIRRLAASPDFHFTTPPLSVAKFSRGSGDKGPGHWDTGHSIFGNKLEGQTPLQVQTAGSAQNFCYKNGNEMLPQISAFSNSIIFRMQDTTEQDTTVLYQTVSGTLYHWVWYSVRLCLVVYQATRSPI